MKTITVTKQQLTQAYMDWEKGIRLNPDEYLTAEEVRSGDIRETSEMCAEHLIKLIESQDSGSA